MQIYIGGLNNETVRVDSNYTYVIGNGGSVANNSIMGPGDIYAGDNNLVIGILFTAVAQ